MLDRPQICGLQVLCEIFLFRSSTEAAKCMKSFLKSAAIAAFSQSDEGRPCLIISLTDIVVKQEKTWFNLA